MKLLPCPNLGWRPLEEFAYGGRVQASPDASACSDGAWADYVFHRDGEPGQRKEWWYHRPSGTWFILERDSASDRLIGIDKVGPLEIAEPR